MFPPFKLYRALPHVLAFSILAALTACSSLSEPGDARIKAEMQSQQALSSGEIGDARQMTAAAIDRFGPSPFLLNQLAVIDDRQGRPLLALTVLTHAHRLFPRDSRITLNLADAEVEAGKVFPAREILLPLLAEKTWPEGFRTLMGQIDLATGNLPESHIFLHEALTRHPDNPLILASMGLLHRRLGLTKKAREEFSNALAHSPGKNLRIHLLSLLASN